MKVLCDKRLICKWAVSCQHASIPHEPDSNCQQKYCILGKIEHECNDKAFSVLDRSLKSNG